jgi:hypothetical protein
MKLKTFSIIGGIAVAGLVSASSVSSASATTLSYTDTFPSTTAPFTKALSFPTFSKPGYALTGVEFVTTLTTNATVSIVNIGTVSHNFTNASAIVPLTVTTPTTGFTANATANIPSGTVTPLVPGGPNNFPASPSTTTTNSFIPTSQFGAYENPPSSAASYDVSVAAGNGSYSGTETGSSGNLFFGGSASVSGSIEVIYTYAQVPEPLTILGGLTALGLGMGLKRQLKSNKKNA